MEEEVRFCTSSDGARLAYAVVGEGPPLICAWIDLDMYWRHPAIRAFKDRLAEGRRLIVFDHRGMGASERQVDKYTLEQEIGDILTIADHLRLDRFDIFGQSDGCPVAIATAALHPERVSRLVLWGGFASAEDVYQPDVIHGLGELILGQWDHARRLVAAVCFPSGPAEMQSWYCDALGGAVSTEIIWRYLNFAWRIDVRKYLPQAVAPTLVLHRQQDQYVPVLAGRAVATQIPNARFVALEGDCVFPWWGDSEAVLRAVETFLADPPGLPAGLTDREMDVLHLLVSGKSNREIAAQLVLSVRTVERHIANIYSKTNAHSRAALTAYAFANGLLRSPSHAG